MDGKLCGDGAGAAVLRGGSVWTSLGHLVGLTPVRNKSETQFYHDLRRPGSAVRMFMRPFVWAECAQHIHVNVLPGCFQIRRANPKRLQLLKKEGSSWKHIGTICSGQVCGKNDNFGTPGTPGCSHGAVHVAFTNLLRKLAWIR